MKNIRNYKENYQDDILNSPLLCDKIKLSNDNLYSTVVQLLLLIKKLNQQSIPPQKMHQTLLTIRKIADEYSIKISQFGSNNELDKKQRVYSYLNETLYIELGKSYQTIINESLKNIVLYKKILISTFENAFFCYYTIIKSAILEHRSVPKNVWLDYHKLFNMSLSHKQKIFPQMNTIDSMYRFCLLLSISNSHCISKNEIGTLFNAINNLSSYLKLTECNTATTRRYIVNLHKDTGPIFIKNAESIIPNCLYLDLSLIIQRLVQLKASYSAVDTLTSYENQFTPAESLLSIPQINFLLKAWDSNRIRIEKRFESKGEVEICFGFSACYRYVQEEIFNKEFIDSVEASILPTLYTAKIVNISKNGFCLSCQDDILTHAAIGELIAIKRKNDIGAKWSLGTIRWLNRNNDESFYLGIQILCENIKPIKSLVLNSQQSSTIPTFILPNQLNMPVTIIAPVQSLLPGSNLEFEYDDHTYQASLVKINGKDAQCDYFNLSFKNMN